MEGDLVRIVVQWLHVTSGVLWIGGGFYTLLVQLPALLAAPPQARGPVMAQLAPRQTTYILRVAELTIATGFVQILVSGRAQQLAEPLGSRWAIAIGLGIVLAFVLYGTVRAVIQPTVARLLTVGPAANAGDAGAQAESGALVARLRRTGQIQVAIGLAILLVMVLARFS